MFRVMIALFAALTPVWAQPDNPVTNGGFEEAAADGVAVDWSYLGTVELTDEAHSGERALRFVRGPEEPGETGLNRAWMPDTGEQGAMLAELKGGLRFHYKAVSAENCQLVVYVIPMSERPFEDTGDSRAQFVVAEEHVGDGEWHEGALKYDFTENPKVKWLHVSVRLMGGPGEMLFDDVRYVERVGPQLAITRLALRGDDENAERATLKFTVANAGDGPVGTPRVEITPPAGLQVSAAEIPDSPLAPDAEVDAECVVTGRRSAGTTIRITARAGELLASRSVSLEPKVRLAWALAEPFLLAPGETTTITARIENDGLAAAEGVRCGLDTLMGVELAGERRVAVPAVDPGGSQTITWQLRAAQEGEVGVPVVVFADDEEQTAAVQLGVTPAAKAETKQFVGSLWYGTIGDRTVGELRVRKGNEWRTVARLPWLARAAVRGGDGEVEYLAPRFEPAQSKLGARALRGTVADGQGGTWTFGLVAAEPELDGKAVRVEWSVQCDRPRELLAFEGPMIYAGEGTTGSAKTEALFPCCEWLVDDELSSSTLDVREGHPDQIRYVPPPNFVTIPYMSVKTPDAMVGLLWDVHQEWDGKSDRPQPVFAMPARFEGRASNLMGLMAPNTMTGLKRNERLAEEPYALRPGTRLRIRAHIYVDADAPDALAAQDAWFDLYGPDPVLPPPEGDYVKQIDFSMIAYLDSLYDEEEQAWWPFLGGPGIWRKLGHDPNFSWDLLVAARTTRSTRLAARYRERAEEQLRLGGGEPSADSRYERGPVIAQAVGLAGRAQALLAGRGDDGAWRFDADRKDQGVFKGMDYHDLGVDDAAELGTCAQSAYEVLRYARISGDREAYREGVKSLEFMKQFTVPRAAQVWEVPVHSPDILAAADAIDAYLEAYQFSGDQQWLAEARRWARAGMPFVYVWSDGRYPWMRYGSIPVFGASWNNWSWFGNLVQWNGLRYAYALLKLDRFDSAEQRPDKRYDWKEIARGITHSAMYQQSTEGENIALWPDSYHTITAGRAAWDFAPRLILKNVYALIGREEEPQTVILAEGEERGQFQAPTEIAPARIHITSGAEIQSAAWREGELSLRLKYPSEESGFTLIAGVTEPSEVQLNGAPLARREGLVRGDDPGWRYDARHASVAIRITEDGESEVTLRGIRHEWKPFTVPIVTRIDFGFDTDAGGWREDHELSPVTVRDGVLETQALGGDPWLIRQPCHIDGNTVSEVVIRMRVTAGTGGQFYWTTTDSPAMAEDKTVQFEIRADGEFHEYQLDVGSDPMWRGKTIAALRLDPCNAAAGAQIGVDYIKGQ